MTATSYVGVVTLATNVNGSADRVLYNDGTNSTNTSSVLTFDGTTFKVDPISLSSTGIVTSNSAANIGIVTYYGDVSNAAHQRWEVTADSPNSYVFVGSGVTHGNRHDPTLYVARGSIVEFVNNMGAHPLQIQTSYQNTGGTAYPHGVTVAGSASAGVIRFEVPHDAPNTLYYQCTSHTGMAGTITIYPSI